MKCNGIDVATGERSEISFGDFITGVDPLLSDEPDSVYVAPGWIDLQVNGFASAAIHRGRSPRGCGCQHRTHRGIRGRDRGRRRRGRHALDAPGQWGPYGASPASELHLGATGRRPAGSQFYRRWNPPGSIVLE